MASFQDRAQKAMTKGDLTVSDLRTWFGRPYATVWQWVNSGWEPGRVAGHQSKKVSSSGKKAISDLELLEQALKVKLFPAPDHISQRLRRDYVRNAYNAAGRARVPQAHPSK